MVKSSKVQIVLAKINVMLKLCSQGQKLLWMCCLWSESVFSAHFIAVLLISALSYQPSHISPGQRRHARTLRVIRLPKNEKAAERDPETRASPCKGDVLAFRGGGQVSFWPVPIVPDPYVLLPAETEVRSIPVPAPKTQTLWPGGAVQQKCQLWTPWKWV